MSIEQNIIETLMSQDGAARYTKDATYKRAHQMFTAPEWSLFRKAFPVVADAVHNVATEVVNGRKRQEWQDVLCEVGTDNVAFIGLQVAFYKSIERKAEVDAASNIGRQVYAQLAEKPEVKDEITLGLQVLSCVMESGLFVLQSPEEFKSYTTLEFTEEAVEQMHSLEEWQKYMRPIYRPMVSKPNSVLVGSYLDAKVASTVSMVKTTNKEHSKLIRHAAESGANFVKAADSIQEVPLQINQWALGVVEKAYKAGLSIGSIPPIDLPPKGRLRSQIRSQQAGFLTDLNEAKEYSKYDEVFLPATLDSEVGFMQSPT
jgi:hypothetical protein